MDSSCLKNDPKSKNKEDNNKNKKSILKKDPKKDEDNKNSENDESILDDDKEEEKGEEKDPKKQKKKKRPKKEKSLISDGKKPDNYSKDSSMISGTLKRDEKEKQNKSLISGSSKGKKDDENDIDVENEINISQIHQKSFADESKNGEDILNEMNGKGDKNNKKGDDNDMNLNINDLISEKDDKNKKKKDTKKDEEIKIDDINSENSLELPKEEEKKEEKKKKEKEKEKEKEKPKKVDSSYLSKYSQVKKQKEEGFYDKDSNLSNILNDDSSQMSKPDNLSDLISESETNNKANPPQKKKGEEPQYNIKDSPEENNPNNYKYRIGAGLLSSKANMKSSGENFSKNNDEKLEEIEEEENEDKPKTEKIGIKKILNTNDELISLDEFCKKHKNFISIYLADLKKHHILYFSFSNWKTDINNIYLKISLFSISIVLYFSLNTIFMTSSKMANVYFDPKNSNGTCALINLFLPFIICGIIILILKYFILPINYIIKVVRTIQSEKTLKDQLGVSQLEEIANNENIPTNKKKRSIKNAKNKIKESLDVRVIGEYEVEKNKLQNKLSPLSPKYKKIIIFYFLIGFIFLGINWYMITSFCAVFRNSGVKLIVNSIVSLIASFALPCLLGFIPTLVGFLAKKLNNRIIFKVYKFINKVI